MSRRRQEAAGRGALSILAVLACAAPLASDPPDSKVNPKSGHIETTDSFWGGSDYGVRHVVNPGNGQPLVVQELSTNSSDDLSPRVAIDSAGNTYVTWWRDAATDEVVYRKRSHPSGQWGSEVRISRSGENSRRPSIVHDGILPRVGYEVPVTGGTKVVLGDVSEDPDPVGLIDLRTTTRTNPLDVQVQYESGHLWVTWTDSSTHVGWSEYDYATASWSAPAYESYESDSVEAARGRVRAGIL